MKFYAPLSNEKMNATSQPGAGPRTNLIFTGQGRQEILSKLDRIRMDTVLFQRRGLSEVVRALNEETKKRDPEKRGISFMVDPNVVAAQAALARSVDPTTGLPEAAASAEPADINTVSINIDPPLSDVRLADVMEAIVKVADKPIKYSIEDYAVVFSWKGPETEPLYTRTFKLNPNALERVIGIKPDDIQSSGLPPVRVDAPRQASGLRFITRTNSMHLVSVALATFFTSLGVDLASPNAIASGKSVFLSDRSGWLLVKATKQDLDAIEHALGDFDAKPATGVSAIEPTSVVTNKPATESSTTLSQSRLQETKDKVPVLGDIPLVGRLFRSGTNSPPEKVRQILVSARFLELP